MSFWIEVHFFMRIIVWLILHSLVKKSFRLGQVSITHLRLPPQSHDFADIMDQTNQLKPVCRMKEKTCHNMACHINI